MLEQDSRGTWEGFKGKILKKTISLVYLSLLFLPKLFLFDFLNYPFCCPCPHFVASSPLSLFRAVIQHLMWLTLGEGSH